MTHLSQLSLALVLVAGCTDAGVMSAGGEDASVVDPSGCVIDSSRDPASAIPLVPENTSPQGCPFDTLAWCGGKVDGQLCPRGDVDWYALTVPTGAELLDMTVGYADAPTRVSIVAQLFSADDMKPVPGGELADTRTGARKGTISSTLRVPRPGPYFVAVRDAMGSESDNLNGYLLAVEKAHDPDTHEPNDELASARVPDGMPGWLAYRGDRDVYKVNVAPGSSLLAVHIENPAAAQTVLYYALQDAKGVVLGEGEAPPAALPLDALRLLPGAAGGDFFVVITGADGSVPDRRPGAGYTIQLGSKPELDANDTGTRNDSGAAATCLAGAPDPRSGCPMPYAGGLQNLSGKGQVGGLGDRDFFRFDVSGGVPAVVEIASSIGDTGMQLALDLLVPHKGSTCTRDSECAAINQTCKADSDCELSHSCLPAATYKFCPNGQSCRLCAGASACVPLAGPGMPGGTVCAAPQYLVHDTTKAYSLRTAQPLFSTGPVYVVVHDFQDDQYHYGNEYSLDVRLSPEPDPGDQAAAAAMRNNFYNPYPMQDDDLRPSAARARDISDDLIGGRSISGFLSYSSDEDWFSFRHPCPKMDCGLVFEWTQPGPSPVRVAFLMRRDDMGIHESWTYSGQVPPPALPGPVTATFGEGDCHECSFASAKYAGKGYYVQVRAVGGKSWDASGAGAYSFRLKAQNPGCPLNCTEAGTPMMPVCGCYCASLMKCPPGPAL